MLFEYYWCRVAFAQYNPAPFPAINNQNSSMQCHDLHETVTEKICKLVQLATGLRTIMASQTILHTSAIARYLRPIKRGLVPGFIYPAPDLKITLTEQTGKPAGSNIMTAGLYYRDVRSCPKAS